MILCINGNAPIYNKWEGSKTVFCPSEFPWARERIFVDIFRKFGHAPSKFSPALPYTIQFEVILVYQEVM
jgi:hypothetical protein